MSMALIPVSTATQIAELNHCDPQRRCPTCLRPFDTGREEARAHDHFRGLPPVSPRLLSRESTSVGGLASESDAEAELPEDTEHESPGYYQKYFVELHKVGHGSFGGVFVVRHVVEGNTLGLFAVKKIPVGSGDTYLGVAINEVRLLEELHKHPNVIEYKHSWIEYSKVADFGPKVRCLFVLMEYATEGSLEGYLEEHGRSISDAAVWFFFLNALNGLHHLHAKHILHRDIKPDNLLLTRDEKDKPPRILLSDFGTAAVFDDLNPSSDGRTGGTGTQDFMAPELLADASGTFSCSHTVASDVWAMGQVLHWLAFEGSLAFVGENGVQLNETVRRPPEMRNLIKSMLDPDVDKRPTCSAILKNPLSLKMMARFEANDWDRDDCRPPHGKQMLLRDRSFRTSSKSRVESAPASPVAAPANDFPKQAVVAEHQVDANDAGSPSERSNWTDSGVAVALVSCVVAFCGGLIAGRRLK